MRAILCFTALWAAVCGEGCATPYQPLGDEGGYSETQLAPDVFRVYFQGNEYTSQERAQDFAMLRAAELTQQNGFKWFGVLNEGSGMDVRSFVIPGSKRTTGTFIGGYYYGRTMYEPDTTYTVSRPRAELLIKCFPENLEGKAGAIPGLRDTVQIMTDPPGASVKINNVYAGRSPCAATVPMEIESRKVRATSTIYVDFGDTTKSVTLSSGDRAPETLFISRQEGCMPKSVVPVLAEAGPPAYYPPLYPPGAAEGMDLLDADFVVQSIKGKYMSK